MALHVAFRPLQTLTLHKALALPLLGFFGVTALLTLPAQARLGWTLDQCIKEYGEPKNTNANKVSFLTAGGRTVNILLDSKGLVQAIEITPINRDEALSFKGEYGIGWVTTDKHPDYSIIPDAEWAKTRVGEMHGVEWNYFPKNKLMLMNTGAAQISFAKEKAKNALNYPITPAANEVATSQGVSSIRQVRRIYVESLGSDGESRLTREKIRAQLIKSKRFVVTDSPSDAQAVVQGAMATRGYTSAYGSSFDGQGWVSQGTTYSSNSTLRVCAIGSGKTLWTWEFEPAKVYWGPFGLGDTDIAKSFVRDLGKIAFGDESESGNTTSTGSRTVGPRRN